MNWLRNLIPPRIRAFTRRENVPENLWHKCPACEQMIFHRELAANLHVCTHCNHHLRVSAKERLDMVFDPDSYQLVELPDTVDDPLRFRDQKRYSERLKESRNKTKVDDAIMVAHGKIGGLPTVIAAFDFRFMGGSMGVAVGEGFVTAAKLAVIQQAPLIVFPSSGGARMQEGILSLMQMPRTTVAVSRLRDAGLPYIVVLADPTTGGVSASFAMLGDIAIAEPGAIIGFAGTRVIEDTIRETLPEGFQRAEYLLEHGMIDMVVPRSEMRDTLIRVLGLLRHPAPAGDVVPLPGADTDAPETRPAETRPAPGE
jgi:acetyl-CoA carboxylase carboxyl transferase subunit beta